MTITQTTTAQSDYAAIVPEIDSLDADFLAWEWTAALTPLAEIDGPDTLSVEEAAHYGII